MKLNTVGALKIIGMGLSIIGAAASVVAGIVGDKKQSIEIKGAAAEAAAEAVANLAKGES